MKNSEIKSCIKGGLISLVISMPFLGMGLWMLSDGDTFWGMLELFCAAVGVFVAFVFFREAFLLIRENFTKAQKIKLILVICTALIVLVLGWAFFSSMIHCRELNPQMKRFVEKPVSRNTVEELEYFDAELRRAGLFKDFFLKYNEQYEAIKLENENLIAAEVQRITDGISAWKTPEKIASQAEYTSLRAQLESLTLSDKTLFERTVKESIQNYNDVTAYWSDFNKLVRNYEVECSGCKGRGSRACSSCNGMGKKGVTFYSEGDWGYKSYSNYTCTSCNGSGRKSCGSCGGRGYHLHFTG